MNKFPVLYYLCGRICTQYCFAKHLRAAVSVLVGPCCPALLSCIGVDVHNIVVLLGK